MENLLDCIPEGLPLWEQIVPKYNLQSLDIILFVVCPKHLWP